jgi:hypothetical protein
MMMRAGRVLVALATALVATASAQESSSGFSEFFSPGTRRDEKKR